MILFFKSTYPIGDIVKLYLLFCIFLFVLVNVWAKETHYVDVFVVTDGEYGQLDPATALFWNLRWGRPRTLTGQVHLSSLLPHCQGQSNPTIVFS